MYKGMDSSKIRVHIMGYLLWEGRTIIFVILVFMISPYHKMVHGILPET